jgi:hypothetical protein
LTPVRCAVRLAYLHLASFTTFFIIINTIHVCFAFCFFDDALL